MSSHQSPTERFKRPAGGLIDYAIKAGKCIHGAHSPEDCRVCERKRNPRRDPVWDAPYGATAQVKPDPERPQTIQIDRLAKPHK